MATDAWPALPSEWKDTYATLHMWTQIVGKVALAQSPPVNHCWGVALQITPRGLSTRLLPHGDRSFTIEFDLVGHQLVIQASDGTVRALPLTSRSVADFYRDVTGLLTEIGLPVRIWPVAVEVPTAIRLDQDTVHHTYDPTYANRFWRILVEIERVLNQARSRFLGKCSPVHFFWGGFDLACTRFSGRKAPPREGPAFMRDAYSHEVISHGFWPGNGSVSEPSFYAYAVPEPEGFRQAKVEPAAAYYDREMGEFFLPYEAVRTASDPAAALTRFVETTYEQAATLGHWDRSALEREKVAV